MPDLDDAYANGAHIDGAADYPPRWATQADAYRTALGDRAQLGVSYGPSDRMAYDLFRPDGPSRGTLIFVHGGYWMKFHRHDWSHLAAGANARGWSVAMPSYDLCPDIRIAGITQQIAQAVMNIAARTDGPLSLAGHSAGGHLVARMCDPGIIRRDVSERIAHVMPISPVADLEPLLRTSMNDAFGLDRVMALAESPILQPKPRCPTTVWVGADERPAFVDQARKLAKAWDCDLVETAGEHHFNVIDAMQDANSDMVRRLTPDT